MDSQITDADMLDLARQVTRNREGRRNATWLTRQAFKQLGIGDAAVIPLPTYQPARRDTYLAVNGEANRLLGPGRYQLRSAFEGVLVIRR